MSEHETPKNWLYTAGGWAAAIGFVVMMIETMTVGESAVGGIFCCFGLFGLVAGGIVSSSAAAVSSDGSMVLKQDNTGQWNWVANNQGNIPPVVDAASHYNEQNTQILSRVISEVRGGKSLEKLDDNELNIVSSAYGVESGSREQKITALHNSDLAKSALKLGAIGVAGGAAAIGTAQIIRSGREKAQQRAEELRAQGREKLKENFEAGKYNINSKIPANSSGEEATEVAHNIILDQLKKQIEKNNLTPQKMFELGDLNRDGKLDPQEIAAALTAATGFSVPAFIVSDSIKEFDLDKDGTLDQQEVNLLWQKLGFEIVEDEENIDEEIDAVLEEIEQEQNIPQEIKEEATPATEQIENQNIDDNYASEMSTENETTEYEVTTQKHDHSQERSVETTHDITSLTEDIDTEFERLIVEMEGARFSSERKELMEKQMSEFLVTVRIEKMERTLIGDPNYRSGQSVHGLLDGGPYIGIVKIPVSQDDEIKQYKDGDEIQVWASLVDFSPSLKRPVLEASEIV